LPSAGKKVSLEWTESTLKQISHVAATILLIFLLFRTLFGACSASFLVLVHGYIETNQISRRVIIEKKTRFSFILGRRDIC
jgi:hypothetical protein